MEEAHREGAVVVDENTLADQAHIPEAALVLEYLTLGKVGHD